jgi:GNAT superfamily N-acetyltransferase
MKQNITVRRARKEDQEALAFLWIQFLQEQTALDPRFAVAEDALERWRNDFPLWLNEESRRIFVAEGEGMIGFSTAHRWWPPPIYEEAVEVYVDELYVAPAARRSGVGRRLVGAVREWAEALGADRLRLGMLAANTPAAHFWEHLGARAYSLTMTIELETGGRPQEASKRKLGF